MTTQPRSQAREDAATTADAVPARSHRDTHGSSGDVSRARGGRSKRRAARRTRAATKLDHAQRVARAVVHAEDHLGGDLSLASISRAGNSSPFHFQRVFRAQTGESPVEFVRRLRLERAARELRDGDAPIASIARRARYSETAAFTRAFQARFGRAPLDFRRRVRARRSSRPVASPASVRVWLLDAGPEHQLGYRPVPASSEAARGRPAARVVDVYTMRLAFLRARGSLAQSSETFRELAAHAGLDGSLETTLFALLVHDDELTPRARRRIDVCVPVGPRRRGRGAIGTRKLGRGTFVVATVQGPPAEWMRVVAWIRARAIPALGCSMRPGAALVVLLDSPFERDPRGKDFLVDVLVPVDAPDNERWYWRRARPLARPTERT